MSKYRFILEPYCGVKSLYSCPSCNARRKFRRYLDTTTGQYLGVNVGICERKNSCGYHYTPKQYFADNNYKLIANPTSETKIRHMITKSKMRLKAGATSYIKESVLKNSVVKGRKNNFLDFLTTIPDWDKDVIDFLSKRYNIGTCDYWQGATIFWQKDINGRIRTGKVMLYNPITGKRIKTPYNHITWMHKVLKLSNFNLQQCYFGEHLLNEEKDKPVAIVESEKTAIIASVLLPEFVWLACGSVNNLNYNKTKILKGRNVVLFPDLECYELWNDKIPNLSKLATFMTSNILEKIANKEERLQGWDIADYLIDIVKNV